MNQLWTAILMLPAIQYVSLLNNGSSRLYSLYLWLFSVYCVWVSCLCFRILQAALGFVIVCFICIFSCWWVVEAWSILIFSHSCDEIHHSHVYPISISKSQLLWVLLPPVILFMMWYWPTLNFLRVCFFCINDYNVPCW